MNDFINAIKTIFLHQTVQIVIAVGGLAVVLVNLFIASRLAPLATNISAIAGKVNANDTRINDDEKYIPQFIATQQKVENISTQLDRIESRVDSIDGFLRGYK